MHTASLSQVKFDAELIARYEGSGPRYTSYPTADRFAEGSVGQQYERTVPATKSRRKIVRVPICILITYKKKFSSYGVALQKRPQ